MFLHLKISPSLAKKMQEGDTEEAKRFRAVFEYAQLRRESWLTRRMVVDNKASNGCMNALKQKKNGGYVDRPKENKADNTLNIKIDGITGGWKSFK